MRIIDNIAYTVGDHVGNLKSQSKKYVYVRSLNDVVKNCIHLCATPNLKNKTRDLDIFCIYLNTPSDVYIDGYEELASYTSNSWKIISSSKTYREMIVLQLGGIIDEIYEDGYYLFD
jgi:hypothetical protein